MKKLRVAIVGAGRRVTQTVLPAVLSLGDRVELVSIHSRTPHELKLPDGASMHSITSLDAPHFEGIDLIILAVGSNSIRTVLNSLEKIPNRDQIALVMDTPPLRLSEFRRFNTFRNYKSVCVGEDWVRLTPVELIHSLIADGKIGTLETITLDRMSYRYHGLATLRAIAGTEWFRSMRRARLGGKDSEYRIVTGNSVKCRTVQPRNYAAGVLAVTGSEGWISNHTQDQSTGTGYLMSFPEATTGWHQPVALNGEVQPPDEVETYMSTLPHEFLEDKSFINRLKIRGYGRLLEGVARSDLAYDIGDGLYDYLAIAILERFGRFYDLGRSDGRSSLLRSIVAWHAR